MVAKRSSGAVAGKPPFVIQAQVLRERQAAVNAGGIASFVLPDEPAAVDRPDGAGAWRTADLKRALAAARDAGLSDYRVEIAPDGTIALVVGASATS